jgi:lysozyme
MSIWSFFMTLFSGSPPVKPPAPAVPDTGPMLSSMVDTNDAVSIALELLSKLEGCKLGVYHGAKDPPDVWSIGYGFTYINGMKVTKATAPISQFTADLILKQEATSTLLGIEKLLPNVLLNAYQLGALISFVYNIGMGAFASSTIRKDLVTGQPQLVPAQFPLWDHSNGQVDPDLQKRRKVELAVYQGGTPSLAFAQQFGGPAVA